MPYELTTIANPQQNSMPSALPVREEKVVSMYSDTDARIAKALSKLRGEPVKIDAPDINDNAEAAPSTSGASLPLSPQLAALARKEQKVRQYEQAVKAKELAIEADRKEVAELKALKAKLAAGDYSEIDKVVDYEKFTQQRLGKDPQAEAFEKLQAKIEALEADRNKDVNERFEYSINQRRSAVKSLVAENPEYSAIKKLNAEEAVVQLILDTWNEDEIELSPEEAAKEVQKELVERSKKWSSLTQTETQEAPAEKRELPPLKPGMKTLTNNMASTGEIKPPSKPLHLMTEQERYAEAYRRAAEKEANKRR